MSTLLPINLYSRIYACIHSRPYKARRIVHGQYWEEIRISIIWQSIFERSETWKELDGSRSWSLHCYGQGACTHVSRASRLYHCATLEQIYEHARWHTLDLNQPINHSTGTGPPVTVSRLHTYTNRHKCGIWERVREFSPLPETSPFVGKAFFGN